MQRTMLKSKIHRATVTGACVDYEGSVTIDSRLLDASDILNTNKSKSTMYQMVSVLRLTSLKGSLIPV